MKAAPLAYCPVCGSPLYDGDKAYELESGELICRDIECLAEAVGAREVTAQRQETGNDLMSLCKQLAYVVGGAENAS